MKETENSSSHCNCVLESLWKTPFGGLNYSNKCDILKQGRPTPQLPTLSTKTKNYTRHFQESWYSSFKWLCGCKSTQKLYCWPCILFSSDGVWTKNGVSDMNNFLNLKNRHENSKEHITSAISLIKFGKSRIDFSLSSAFKLSVEKHNEQVRKNRHIVSCLIDATCFLASQELSFRGHHETQDSDNRGNYVEILHLLAQKDECLASHLESKSVFQGI